MRLNETFAMMEEDEYCGNRRVELGWCPFLSCILGRPGNKKSKLDHERERITHETQTVCRFEFAY